MKTKSEVFQIAKEMGWENPGPGIKRQIMGYDGQLMMVKVVFEEGAVGTMHEHYAPTQHLDYRPKLSPFNPSNDRSPGSSSQLPGFPRKRGT